VSLTFTTPLAALVALVGLVPVGVLLAERERLRRVCALLGLRPPAQRRTLSAVVALVMLVALLALAAAQPVAATRKTEKGRADAEAFFVFDTSRSMGASSGPGAPTRLDRARADGKALRVGLPDLPTGIASLTDRALPHLFPSMSINDFNATLDESLAIDRPTSSLAYGDALGTRLGALSDLVAAHYFSPSSKRRVVVVFTDGETLPQELSALPRLFRQEHVTPLFFQYWGRNERVYDAEGRLNPAYAPDPALTEPLTTVARVLSAHVYKPAETSQAAAAIRAVIGDGPMTTRGRELSSRLLTPYLVLLALLPLGFLLGRDEWGSWRRRHGRTATAAATGRDSTSGLSRRGQ
jgi:hypothetical protein